MDTMRHEQFMRAKAEEEKHDPVNKPSHYTQGEIECIDAIEAALGPEGFKAFCRGNVIKYSWRTEHKHKDGQQDLEKARWYLNRIIEEHDPEPR